MPTLDTLPYELCLSILRTVSLTGDLPSLLSLAAVSRNYQAIYTQNRADLDGLATRVYTGDFYRTARAYAQVFITGTKRRFTEDINEIPKFVDEALEDEVDGRLLRGFRAVYRVHGRVLKYMRRKGLLTKSLKANVSSAWRCYRRLFTTSKYNNVSTQFSYLYSYKAQLGPDLYSAYKGQISRWQRDERLRRDKEGMDPGVGLKNILFYRGRTYLYFTGIRSH